LAVLLFAALALLKTTAVPVRALRVPVHRFGLSWGLGLPSRFSSTACTDACLLGAERKSCYWLRSGSFPRFHRHGYYYGLYPYDETG
jgi:hypothetical protein